MQARLKLFLLALGLCGLLSARSQAAVQLQIGAAAGPAGTSVAIPLSIQADTPVTAFQVDVVVDPPVVTFDAASEVTALPTHVADVGLVAPGVYRILTYSVFNATLPNGPVLNVQAGISPLATNGSVALRLTNAIVASPAAAAAPDVTLSPATLKVGAATSIQLSAVQISGNIFQFQVNGLKGGAFIVENSADLKTWKTFATPTAAGGVAIFSAPTAGQKQFFRVKTQ